VDWRQVRLLTSQGVTLPAAIATERLCLAARCGNLPVNTVTIHSTREIIIMFTSLLSSLLESPHIYFIIIILVL
jgi:hypothetical protein